MTPFQTVLFDLDGTLIDTNHLIVTSFQHVFRTHLNLELSAEQLHTHFGEPLPTTMARYAPDRADELVGHYRSFNMAQHDLLVREFRGVRAAVQAMAAAGVRLAVVTSKRTDTAKQGLRLCHLDEFFPLVVGMDATEKHKPDPEPALFALRRLQVEPGPHVLMVGDSHFDILCGRNAGLKTAAVGWSVQTREALSGYSPDFWLESPEALQEIVLGRR